MSYVTYTLLLLSLLLGCLAATGLRAEDTYNFYFQKAPGPVTVNQGGAPSAQKPTDPEKALEEQKAVITAPATAPTQPAPAASTGTAVAAEPEPARTYRPFELSFGLAGSSSTDPNGNRPTFRGNYGSLLTGQFLLGVQFNPTSWIGFQAEGFYLKGNRLSDSGNYEIGGSRLDYAGSLVITPIRFRAGQSLRISASALGGWVTVPHHGWDLNTGLDAVEHRGTAYYGARVSFDMWDRVALQASLRRFVQFDSPTGTIAVAALF